MTIEELDKVIKQANLRKIKKALKAAGFIDCKRSKALRHASLYHIATAHYERTPYYLDRKGNEYIGDLCQDVKDYEQYEFVVVQFLAQFKRGCKGLSTKKMLIYAKEAKNDLI